MLHETFELFVLPEKVITFMKKTHIILKSIYSSFHSASKILYNILERKHFAPLDVCKLLRLSRTTILDINSTNVAVDKYTQRDVWSTTWIHFDFVIAFVPPEEAAYSQENKRAQHCEWANNLEENQGQIIWLFWL